MKLILGVNLEKDQNNSQDVKLVLLNIRYRVDIQPKTSRFGSVVAHPDMDGEVSGSSPGHTKDLKKMVLCYCSSACADHNELE